jgi:hypothetical protein
MLDRPVPEVGLDRAGVDALVSQLKSAGMTKHVRVDLHFEAGSLASALDHCLKDTLGEWRAVKQSAINPDSLGVKTRRGCLVMPTLTQPVALDSF